MLELSEDLSPFVPDDEDTGITIEKTGQGCRVTLTGNVSEAAATRLAAAITSNEVRARFESEVKRHKLIWQKHTSPAKRGVRFVVPQLCFTFDGALELVESEAFLDASGWSLLDYPAELSEAEFRLTETGVQWEIDLSAAGKITERAVGKAEQYDLDLVDTGWTQNKLCRWLEHKARQIDITQSEMLEFVRRTIACLIEKRALPLTALVRWRFILAKVLTGKIAQYREQASRECYQQTLVGPQAAVETSFTFEFGFQPDGYAPHWTYTGHPYQFQKHYLLCGPRGVGQQG